MPPAGGKGRRYHFLCRGRGEVSPDEAPAGARQPSAVQLEGRRPALDAKASAPVSAPVRLPAPMPATFVQVRGYRDTGRTAEGGLSVAIAETVSDAVDGEIFGPVRRIQCVIMGIPDPEAASAVLDQSQQWLQDQVQAAFGSLTEAGGVAEAQADLARRIGANLVLDPIADLEQKATLILDLAGIAIGIIVANHLLVVGGIKDIARKEFHSQVSHELETMLDRLSSGKGQSPGAPQTPTSARQAPRVPRM